MNKKEYQRQYYINNKEKFKKTNVARVLVSCKDCSTSWNKNIYSVRLWQGRCRSCAQKVRINTEDSRRRRSQLAREQLLRQKGIRNAKKFNSETRGENHPRWKGGITPEYIKIRLSKEYKDWRLAVMTRDNFTCVFCGQRGGRLEVDHIKQFAYYPEFRFDMNNGRTLCKECHKKTPTYLKSKKMT